MPNQVQGLQQLHPLAVSRCFFSSGGHSRVSQQDIIIEDNRQNFSGSMNAEVLIPEIPIITDPSGRRYSAADLMKPPSPQHKRQLKLQPKIIRQRLEALKTYEGNERSIRGSPWRLQLVCRHVVGMTLEEALTQLSFLNKRMAPLVHRVLKRTSNLADIRDSVQMSQLEIAECFATQGSHLKRIKYMARGRNGVMHHKFAHMRVVLREIDFPLKLYTARTPKEKQRWLDHYMRAQAEYEQAKAQREELEALERIVALKSKEIS